MTDNAESTSAGTGMEQWDLTDKVSPYLDRHMVFPLLEYLDTLIENGTVSYRTTDVAAARLALLTPTHMVDYAIDIYKSIHGQDAAVPAEMEQQKDQVYKDLEELKKKVEPFDELCKDKEERAKLVAASKWTVAGVTSSKPEVTAEIIDTYLHLSRFMFDCGDYKLSRDMLVNYISLFANPPASTQTGEGDDEDLIAAGITQQQQQQQQQQDDNKHKNANIYYLTTIDESMLKVLWGRLACDILLEEWEAAAVAVEAVKAAMEYLVGSNRITALEALQQRTWLLHWSLFVYWNDSGGGAATGKDGSTKGGLESLVELFHTERYRQAITTNAPHLLRYLTAAVLLCKRRITSKKATASGGANAEARRLMKNLINVMSDCEYTDPIVDFVNCLCVKFDFDNAQTKLAECEKVLASDFFLCHQTALFMEEARVFVFENYCRIHNKIDLKALGEKLAMDQNEAERWIVDLIRNADLDAKIDSDEGCVVMGGNPLSIYEQVMDRTRDLNVRSATLAQNLNNLLIEARKEKMKRERTSRDDEY